jgi:hypothetical protein
MAMIFSVCTAPDSHISYLQQHAGAVHSYLDGVTPPASEVPTPLPEWWPNQPPKLLDLWDINHRNIDLYHCILNGGPDLVTNGGSIFQSWYEPTHPASYVKLDEDNVRFAFYSNQINELASLVAAVNVKSALKAFIEWCKSQGKTWEDLDEYACESFVVEFKTFGDLLSEATYKRHGIIW